VYRNHNLVCAADLLQHGRVRHSGLLLNALPDNSGGWIASACALLFGCFAVQASVPNYFIRVWQTDEGLPQNGVTAIVQSQDGYLWVGTYSGLARFDGVRFTIFNTTTTQEMFSSRVTSLFEDSTGTLWIGYETGGLMRYKDGVFQSSETPASNGKRIVSIAEDQPGDIWALAADGSLLRLRDGLVLAAGTAATSELGSLVKDRSGKTWVLWNGTVSLLEGDHLMPAPFGSESTNGHVQGICASRDGGLWVASLGRVRKRQETGWVEDLGLSPWGLSAVTSAFIDSKTWGLASGVVDRGLDLVLPDRTALYLSRTNGLPSDWVRALCEDREGNLWMGTANGLAVLRVSKVAVVDAPGEWQGRAVLSLSEARNGALWVGTEGAGLYRLKQNEWTHFGAVEGVLNSFVWSVSEDAQGRVWAGTWGGGLLVQSGDHFQRAPGFEDVLTPALALLHVADGSTWVGTETGLAHWKAGKVEWYGRNTGLIYPDVRAVVQDSKGTVWFGMLGGGLGVLKEGAVSQFRKLNGLSSDFVQCLKLEKDGSLWIGTFGGGLNRLKHGRFAVINASQGLPNDVICDIEDDGRGNFWFSSHGGIFRVSKELLNQCADGVTNSLHCLTYGKGDGLPTLECSGGFQPAGCMTADGRLWFPTSKGLVVVDPNERNLNHLPPPVIIEDLLVSGQKVPRQGADPVPVRIRPGDDRFEFVYTGLSLVAPEKVRFKYRLEGLEREWVDAGTKRTATYKFIPPGNYTFHVIACNNDDIWNEVGQTLRINVVPRFWQTWWFRVLSGCMIAAVIGIGVWFETQRRMRWKLERLERQRAVERERARIAQDIHDDLGASLTRITLLSQSARGDFDNPAEAAANLDRIYGTARELTRAMDEIVWAVNPQHDTLDSLASYLGKYAQDFLGAADVSCRLDFSVQLPPWPLRAEVRHNLFLAFKEALHNVVQHAAASEVRVSLTPLGSAFSLDVADNGRGFVINVQETRLRPDSDRLARGNGIANVRRRLAAIGGHCEIRSAPGQGTQVHFVVPVPLNGPGQNQPESRRRRAN
jgi:signal transduction histidine kinase/ligand-binding sensor domain-containing protein